MGDIGIWGGVLGLLGTIIGAAVSWAVMAAKAGRILERFERLHKDVTELEANVEKTNAAFKDMVEKQVSEIRRLIQDTTVKPDHMLLQLQTLELRVLNNLLERVIKLLKIDHTER